MTVRHDVENLVGTVAQMVSVEAAVVEAAEAVEAVAGVVGFISEHVIITIAVIILVVIQRLFDNREMIKQKATKISSKINEY